VFVNGARVYLPGLVTETNRHPHDASGDDKKKKKKKKKKKNDRGVSCRTQFPADDRPSNPRSIDRNC